MNLFLVDQWITTSFPIIRMILIIAIVLMSLGIIFTVMIQPSSDGSLGAIGGQSDTYFSKNKEKTLEGTARRLTIILSAALFVSSILFFVTLVIYPAHAI